MKRWTSYIPIDGVVVAPSDGYTAIEVPPQYLLGKQRARIRASLFGGGRNTLTPVIDGAKISQRIITWVGEKSKSTAVIHSGVQRASEFVTSTIMAVTGSEKDNLLVGRSERAADRTVLGSFPLPLTDSPSGTWLDTAAGFQAYMAATPFDIMWLEGVPMAPDWVPSREPWRAAQVRRWLIATVHPEGGVSFVKMMDWWAGPEQGLELWWCNAPEKMFAGHTPEEHCPVAWIWEWSDDKPPQPYGPLYMCEACCAEAKRRGIADVGYGGDNHPNRFIQLKSVEFDMLGEEHGVGTVFVTRYSAPASVSGKTYEYYYGHNPLHNTVADANARLVESAGGGSWSPLKKEKYIDEDGDGKKETSIIGHTYPWAMPMTQGRNQEMRGIILGQVGLQPLVNEMYWYDPWFSDERIQPIMHEFFVGEPVFDEDIPEDRNFFDWLLDPRHWSGTLYPNGAKDGCVDFQAPRQYMDSKSTLSNSYLVGEWSFPTETVFKYHTKPDELFHEIFPIDQPLGMRGYNMGAMFSGGKRRTAWRINVTAPHFYCGSNSNTLATGDVKREFEGPALGVRKEAARCLLMFASTGSLMGLLFGISDYNSFNIGFFGYHRPRAGVAGDPDHPTRYVRMGYDREPKSYLLNVPNNADHSRITILPNKLPVPSEERRTEQRFGCVPSVSAFLDHRGELVVLWPHHKRWMNPSSVNMQTTGYEAQYRIEGGYRGWAANPNRVHSPSDYGACNIQAAATTSNRWALLVWDQYIPEIGRYIPWLQLVDARKAFTPNGFLRKLDGGRSMFIPSEEYANKIMIDNAPGLPAVIEEDTKHNIKDDELHRDQSWRHVYPLPMMGTNVVLLVGDKEILCQWDGEEMTPLFNSREDDAAALAHIYLRLSPFSLFAPPSNEDLGDGLAASLSAIPLQPPTYRSHSLGQGYNPTAMLESNGDILIFFNTAGEPGRVLPYHGSGTVEYEATILPDKALNVRVEGAPLIQNPDGEIPAVQLYLSLYPASHPIRCMRITRAAFQKVMGGYLKFAEKGKTVPSEEIEPKAFQAMFDNQEKIATLLTTAATDDGLAVSRDGAPITPTEFESVYARVAERVKTWLSNPKMAANQKWANADFAAERVKTWLSNYKMAANQKWTNADFAAQGDKLVTVIYNQEPALSKTQCFIIARFILTGGTASQAATVLATRSYLERDADTKCPACGAYELTTKDVFNDDYGHMKGFFTCGVCGNLFEDDCHYIELEYVDAIHDNETAKTWLCGGLYEENKHLGITDGNLYVSWKVRNNNVWAAERTVILSAVDYNHIQNSDPGPEQAAEKPYLWDQSDTSEVTHHMQDVDSYTGKVLRKWDETEPEFFKNPLPPDNVGQVEHITYVPPHKPKLLAKNHRLYIVTMTRELYDAQLAKIDRETLEGYNPGDHVAHTASPTIPRIVWTTDGRIWNNDYSKRLGSSSGDNSAPGKDVYEQPKRDQWELPADLKRKTRQG